MSWLWWMRENAVRCAQSFRRNLNPDNDDDDDDGDGRSASCCAHSMNGATPKSGVVRFPHTYICIYDVGATCVVSRYTNHSKIGWLRNSRYRLLLILTVWVCVCVYVVSVTQNPRFPAMYAREALTRTESRWSHKGIWFTRTNWMETQTELDYWWML